MNQYRTLLPYIKPYWQGAVWGMVLVVFASAFTLAGPALIGRAIDVMRVPGMTIGPVLDIAGLLLLVALLGAATATLWPFVPALQSLPPLGLVLAVAAWLAVLTRLRHRSVAELLDEVGSRLEEPPESP